MLAIRLPQALENRLSDLAKKTGRSKSYYARKALEAYLDQRETFLLSLAKLESENPNAVDISDIKQHVAADSQD